MLGKERVEMYGNIYIYRKTTGKTSHPAVGFE